MRELSTETQLGWIERLFSRLASLYGAAFGRQWEGTNLVDVKAVWAEKLGGFNAHQIGEALKLCDDRQYPPNLPEFLGLCRRAIQLERPKMIEAPVLSKEEMRRRAEQINGVVKKEREYDYKAWANELNRRYLAVEELSDLQLSLSRSALGIAWVERT